MGYPEFLQYEGRLCRKAWSQTWATVKQDGKGILWTIGVPIVLAFLVPRIPAVKSVFSGGGLMQEWIIALVGIALAIAFGIGVFTKNLILAPSATERERQKSHDGEVQDLKRDLSQKDERLKVLEEERVPKFAVEPFVGECSNYEKTELTAWADLKIENTSTSVPLSEVSVKIVELLLVCGGPNTGEGAKGTYRLYEPLTKWPPASAYWSGRTGAPGQFSRPINPREAQYATIAFHRKNGSGLGEVNVLSHPPLLESKITIEVSSPNSNTWKGDFYIAYQPKGMGDKFEFVDWESWCKNHAVIEQSTPDKGGSQP